MKMKTVFEKDTWKVLEREDGKFLVRLTTEEAKKMGRKKFREFNNEVIEYLEKLTHLTIQWWSKENEREFSVEFSVHCVGGGKFIIATGTGLDDGSFDLTINYCALDIVHLCEEIWNIYASSNSELMSVGDIYADWLTRGYIKKKSFWILLDGLKKENKDLWGCIGGYYDDELNSFIDKWLHPHEREEFMNFYRKEIAIS